MIPLSVTDYRLDPSPPAIDRVERALLGALIVEPRLRILVDLPPEAFRSPSRGQVWDVLRTMRHPDLPLLCLELERRGIPAPGSGWGTALAELMESPLPFDEDVEEYVRAIKEAAVQRKFDGRRGRAK